jgi:hypothetical protein
MQKFAVKVLVAGKPDFQCEVEARNEHHARTRAMIRYPHSLRGSFVDYEVRPL